MGQAQTSAVLCCGRGRQPAKQVKSVEANIAMLPEGFCGKSLTADGKAQQGVLHAMLFGDGSTPALPPGIQVHWQPVQIHNARDLQPMPTLEADGFQLVRIESAVSWSEGADADVLWCQEVVALAKKNTGAQEALVLGGPTHRDGTDGKGYAGSSHTDHSQHCEEFLPKEVLAACDGKHFAVFNFWRSTDRNQPVKCYPLALLRPSSVSSSDLVYCEQYSERFYKKMVQESTHSSRQQTGLCCNDDREVDGIHYSTYRAAAAHKGLEPDRNSMEAETDCNIVFRHAHSEQHSWVYFPDMTFDEVLIFRQYDTREDELKNGTVFHSAFRDHTSCANPPPRHSCEVRLICIFDERPDAEVSKRSRLNLLRNAFSAPADQS